MNEILNLLNPWWFNRRFETGIERPQYTFRLLKSLGHKRVVLLVGSRRVGKTTLLHQTIAKLIEKNVPPHHILYALMDHPQISTSKIYDLVREFRKQFNLDRKEKIYLFFDEIQYISNWEREIKALFDTENVKIFLSGSASSRLIIKSPYLTGRLEKIDVNPLDFNEFLTFRKAKISEIEPYKLEKYTDEYLKLGGYPEYVLTKDPSYFSDLVNNILFKDIINLYKLKNPQFLKDLILLLSDRVGHRTTFTKLASILSLKMDTVKKYMFYLENTFLIDELPRFTSSRGARVYGPKKFYLWDNGILFNLLGKLSYGQAFEQTVFNFLKTKYNLGFYYENQKEVDFVVRKNGKTELWEAKYKINEENRKQNLDNYLKIAKRQKAGKIVFVTKDFEKKSKIDNITIQYTPLWKLMTN